MTMTETIISRAAKKTVHTNESVNLRPDHVIMYECRGVSDYCIDFIEKYAKLDPSKLTLFIDHNLPARTPADTALHNQTLSWGRRYNVPVIHSEGIGHQYMIDQGLVLPGEIIVHFDRHINISGAVGAFGVASRLETILSLGAGFFPLQVPESIQVSLIGQLPDGVMARDLYAYILNKFGPAFSSGRVIEFSGPGAAHISIDERMSICCQAMFLGGVTALFEVDHVTQQYYREHFGRNVDPLFCGAAEDYSRVVCVDLSEITPYVVAPPSPQNAIPLSSVRGLSVQQGYIGSCASGRLEDLAIAARILKGRRIPHGSRLYVIPSSKSVMTQVCRLGYMETLIEAGAFISSPTCEYCTGRQGALADGERAISTGTLNVPGRMGNIHAGIYNASAASVAAALVTGRITDPREFL